MIWKHFRKCESRMLTTKLKKMLSHISCSFLFSSFFHIFSAIFCVNIYPLFPLPTYTWYLLQAVFFSSFTIIYFSHWNALRFQKGKTYLYWRSNQWMLLYRTCYKSQHLFFFSFFLFFLKKVKNLSFQASHRFQISS